MEKRARGRPSGGGSKLQRSETVTIRLDPKLRYLTELAARKQRRTVSSFIEWAIEQALSKVILDDDSPSLDLMFSSSLIWDPDEADRLAKLALYYPDLLTYDEQVIWKLIKECPWLWHGAYEEQGRWQVPVQDENLNYQLLREEWETLKKVAAGQEDQSVLAPYFRKERATLRTGQVLHKVISREASKRRLLQSTPHEPSADQKTL